MKSNARLIFGLLLVLASSWTCFADKPTSFYSCSAALMKQRVASPSSFGHDEIDYLIRYFSKTPENQACLSVIEYQEVIEAIFAKYPKSNPPTQDQFVAEWNSRLKAVRESKNIEQSLFDRQVVWTARLEHFEGGLLTLIRNANGNADVIERELENQRDFVIPAVVGVWNASYARRGASQIP